MASFYELLRDCIPSDHSRQVDATYYLTEAMTQEHWPRRVLDLGCGRYTTERRFRELQPEVHWVGVDIPDSQEAKARTSGEQVVHYDGTHLPFHDRTFGLVFSRQVFEHVRKPAQVLAEVHRILTPGGSFIGSVSQLEPYHSHSVWNYTVYGFKLLVEEAGLTLEEVRPGIDGLSLIKRSFDGRPPESGAWFSHESPLNAEIDEWAKATGRNAVQANARKLQYAGHFSFRVRRPNTPARVVPKPAAKVLTPSLRAKAGKLKRALRS